MLMLVTERNSVLFIEEIDVREDKNCSPVSALLQSKAKFIPKYLFLCQLDFSFLEFSFAK